MAELVPAGGGWLSRIGDGLRNFGNGAMLPNNPNAAGAMDPEQLAQLRKASMLQAGLGMMAASERGAGFGGAALAGLGQGTNTYNSILQQSYQNAMETKRTKQREEIAKRADQWEQLKFRTANANRTQDQLTATERFNQDIKLRQQEADSNAVARAAQAAQSTADADIKRQTSAYLERLKVRVDQLDARRQMGGTLSALEQAEYDQATNAMSGGTNQGLLSAQQRGLGMFGDYVNGGAYPSGNGDPTGNLLLDSGFTGLEGR